MDRSSISNTSSRQTSRLSLWNKYLPTIAPFRDTVNSSSYGSLTLDPSSSLYQRGSAGHSV
jgi:hypothetical protein